LPGGTEGVPSCSAASAGKRKLPASSQAAGRPALTPVPTELNHPRAGGIHSAAPQLPLKVSRLQAGRAEPVSATTSAPAISNTAALLSTTPVLRPLRVFESPTNLSVRRETLLGRWPRRDRYHLSREYQVSITSTAGLTVLWRCRTLLARGRSHRRLCSNGRRMPRAQPAARSHSPSPARHGRAA
jgi:hypothetical protein